MRGKTEIIYKKAFCYHRSDISSAIEEGKSIRTKAIQDFYNNVLEYEKTGEQQYKDKATGRYYHRILWQGDINYITEGKNLSYGLNYIKKKVIRKEKLPMAWHNDCYACLTHCDKCPISRRAGICYKEDAAFSLLCAAIKSKNKQEAIKQAEIIMEAWEK